MASGKGGSAAWLLAALATLVGCGGSDDEDPTLRQTSYGRVQGANDAAKSGTYAWKGVPFAKAPTGALRWKAPAEPDSWADIKATTRFGNACIQYGRIYGPGSNNTYDATIATTLGQAVGSEDCLYLNIWRPASADAGLPVIVFIHGGSNVSGLSLIHI